MKKILLLLTSIVWVAIANSQDTAKHTVIAQVATPALLPPPGGGGSEPIGGSTSVVAGQTYTYSFPYAGTNQWSISGGSFVNGSVGISVSVIWTQAGTGTISVNNTTANTYGSLTVTIASPPLGGGSISPSSQIVNYGSSATALTYSGATGGNGTAVTYQWQESFDDVTWTNLSGTTGTSYNPGVLDETVFFRVAATQGGSTVYSAAASVSSTATVASPVMVSSTDNDGTSNVSLSNTVGTSNGSAGVNSLGGSSYTIPFDVLPGTAGMQPNVGLVYNSQGGVGIAGWGWNLTGISSITRAGKNTYYNGYTAPVAYSDSDAFVLDGQRLFATSGTNGSDGTIYGQENEDFSQIVSHGGNFTSGPAYFTVLNKDGSTLEYGLAADAKLLTNDEQSTMVWLLDKITDKNGNYCTFIYDIDGSKRAYALMEIDYTGNSNTGSAPYNKIKFTYANRNNYQNTNTYQSGYSIASPFLLNTVSVVNSGGTTVKTYSCTYSLNNGEYFLRYFTEKGAAGGQLNPLRFSYGSDTSAAAIFVSPQFTSLNTNATMYAGNFSGNGIDEVLDATYATDNNGVRHYGGYTILNNIGEYGNQPALGIDYYTNFANSNNNVSDSKYNGYSVLTNDYDGDGKADVLYTNYTASGSTCTLNRVQINCTKYYGVYTGDWYDSLVYATLPTASGYSGNFKYMDSTFIIPGDFDGDGNQDYILVLGLNSTNEYKAFFNSPKKGILNQEITNFGVGGSNTAFYANTIASVGSENIVPIDFDGDGKTDLLIQTPTTTYILTVNPGGSSGYNYQATILATTTAIVAGNRVYPGDFNGDGKTDLLVRTVASLYGTWDLFYSTGKSFNEYAYAPPHGILLDDQNQSSSHLLMVADVNGDGRTDIIHCLDAVQGSNPLSYHDIAYSEGEPLPGTNSTTAFINETNSVAASINLIGNKYPVYGDFNGDGKSDLITLQNVNAIFVYPKPFKEDHLMTKAVNGLGAETDFSYNMLNYGGNVEGSSLYSRSVQYYYDTPSTPPGQGSNGNPYNVIDPSMYVVTQIAAPNGIGGQFTTQYSYMDAAVQNVKGFLGFKQVTALNESTGMQSITVSDINTQFFVPHTIAQYTIDEVNDTIEAARITDTLLAEHVNTLDKRYVYHVNKTLSMDNLKGYAAQSSNTYDNYGNVTANTTIKGYMSGSAITATETTATSSTYGTYATPVPAYPTAVTVTNTRSGQSAVSKETTYAYDTKGNMTSEVDFAGTSLATTTTNTYNGFGDVTQTTMSAPSTTTPTVTNTYDNTGRFLTQKQTTGSSITKTEKYTYEPVWGMPATYTSTDGLVTTYGYDANFPRQTSEKTPDGNTMNTTYAWESSGNARYSTTSQRAADGGMYSKVYNDIIGRKIETQTGGFNGNLLTATTTYDYRGVVTSESPAHYSSESVNSVTYTYDNDLRTTGTSNGVTSVTISYSKASNGQYTTTTTNGASQASSKTDDAAGRTVKATDNGGTLTYTYNSWGKQTAVQLGGNTLVSAVYDAYGRQTSQTDKNAGTISYQYDALGRITKQTDADSHATTIAYDAFGRVTSRTGGEGTTTYTYYNNTSNGRNNDNIAGITGFSGDVTANTYDTLGRLTTQTVTYGGTTFTKTMAYDSYSNLIQTTYPSGEIINDTYDKDGTLTKTTLGSGASAKTLFTATAMNSKGIYTGYTYGNNKAATVTFNLNQGVPTRYYTAGIQDLNYTFDANTNNLLTRKDAISNLTETFKYDNLNRLTSDSVSSSQHFTMTYDNTSGTSLGNIVTKTDVGKYVYDNNKINAVDYVTSTAGGTTPPSVLSQNAQTISYTAFLKADSISQNNYLMTYAYGQNQQRIKEILMHGDTTIETKYYLGPFERLVQGSVTTDILYVTAGNGLCAIVVKQGNTITPYFAYTDHLGSILTVTDTSGTVVARQSFDAWGRNRNPSNWTYTGVPTVPAWLYRGFESQEAMPVFALINFNGRIYDPALGRMLGPDPNITYPLNTQAYNRYGFALDNPLLYFDPTGLSIFSSIGHFFSHDVLHIVEDVAAFYINPIGYIGASLISTGHIFSNVSKWNSNWWKGAITADLIAGAALVGGEAIAGAAIPAVMAGAAEGVGSGVLGTAVGDAISKQHFSVEQIMSQLFTSTTTGAITGALSSGPITKFLDKYTGISSLISGSSFLDKAIDNIPTSLLGSFASVSLQDYGSGNWKHFGNSFFSTFLGKEASQFVTEGARQWQENYFPLDYSDSYPDVPLPAAGIIAYPDVGIPILGKVVNGILPALAGAYAGQIITDDTNPNFNKNVFNNVFNASTFAKTFSSSIYGLGKPVVR